MMKIVLPFFLSLLLCERASSQALRGLQGTDESNVLYNLLHPTSGDALDDTDSYAFKAYDWLLSKPDQATMTDERRLQCYALACIYYATYAVRTPYTDGVFGGPDAPVYPWINSNGWLTEPDECLWDGVKCNGDGKVEELNLRSRLMTGSFPHETTLLKDSLKTLDVFNNFLNNEGEDGNWWLGELVQLELLYLGSNNFAYDGIPPYIGNLVNLVEFDCSYTYYFGELRPEVFANLDKLVYLYIGGNSYNSPIPMVVGTLPSLQYLYAENTDITGDLSFIVDMPSILELWIDENPQLNGVIPVEIGDLSTLASFSVSKCGLTGPIPVTVGDLAAMQQMWLFGNNLTGTIPTEFGNLPNLNRLELEDNSLQGVMPLEVCDSVYPRGGIMNLEADCQYGEIFCPSDCCTCCGAECANSS